MGAKWGDDRKNALKSLHFTVYINSKSHTTDDVWEKNLFIMPVSLLFYNIVPNLAQILPQDHTHFDFLAGFQWNILRDSIDIKFNWNRVVVKIFC